MKYDCIWTNWTLCYLDDGDMSKFLRAAAMNLRKIQTDKKWKTGLLFVKENIEEEE